MARGRAEQLQLSNRWRDREISPERTKVWSEPNPKLKPGRKVPVVYYLSRDGQLEHPHFMEVIISSHEGLFLRDVINRLNSLRGKGIGSMYSWSSKRSYKNGFVWHDLCESDFIYPVHGHEYVLKGSELLEGSPGFKALEPEKSPESQASGENCGSPQVVMRSRNHSWSSVDINEYKVYKSESTGKAADATTQTDEKRQRRRLIIEEDRGGEGEGGKIGGFEEEKVTELNREEISPPPSNSSPETLETLIKADGSVICASRQVDHPDVRGGRAIEIHTSGRMKASTMLMQLISCGTFSVKDCGGSGSDQGFSLFPQYKNRVYGGAPNQECKALESPGESTSFGRIQLEDKEYFSGSLIETRKNEFAALKRSSSYDAERGSKLDLQGAEIDGARAKCIPRRPKMTPKESCSDTSASK